jgi:hypothetical protein
MSIAITLLVLASDLAVRSYLALIAEKGVNEIRWALLVALLLCFAIVCSLFLPILWNLAVVCKGKFCSQDGKALGVRNPLQAKFSLHEDELGREKFVDRFLKHVRQHWDLVGPVVCLSASWGEGKSTILNFLESKIKSDSSLSSVSVFRLNPGEYRSSEELGSALLRTLDRVFSKEFLVRDLPSQLKEWIGNNNVLGSEYLSLVTSFSEDQTLAERLAIVDKILANANRRALVFIDELDRLEASKIVDVLSLLSINGQFSQIRYIVCADKKYVQDRLSSEKGLPANFVDKYFNQTIRIPVISGSILESRFFNDTCKFLTSLGFDNAQIEIYRQDVQHVFWSGLSRRIRNLRDLNLLVAGLNFNQNDLWRDAYPMDVVLLQFVRNFYPHIYEDIWREPGFYMEGLGDPKAFHSDPLPRSLGNKDPQKVLEALGQHFDPLLVGEDRLVLIPVLSEMFPERFAQYAHASTTVLNRQEAAREKKRISSSECFSRYFEDIEERYPDLAIQNMIRSWNERADARQEEIASILHKSGNDIGLFLRKVKVFSEQISQNVSRDLLRAMLQVAEIVPTCAERGVVDFEDLRDHVISYAIRAGKQEVVSVLDFVINKDCRLPWGTRVILVRDLTDVELKFDVDGPKYRQAMFFAINSAFIPEGSDFFNRFSNDKELSFVLFAWATKFWADNNQKDLDASAARTRIIEMLKMLPGHLPRVLRFYAVEFDSGEIRFRFADFKELWGSVVDFGQDRRYYHRKIT